MATEFSHQELTLLLFALEGGRAGAESEPSCEEACPVVENLERQFLNPTGEKQLARHLSNHLREALIESGMLDLMATLKGSGGAQLSAEDRARLDRANERLRRWSCEIKLDGREVELLRKAVSGLPRSAWLSIPRTLWGLRKKLRAI
jgi:hypothetical protein